MNALLVCALMFCAVPEGQKKENIEIKLIVGYDKSEACKPIFPILAEMRKVGYNIAYADITKPANQQYLKWFEFTETSTAPYFLLYRGHEAWEKCHGMMTSKQLTDWYWRAYRGEKTVNEVGIKTPTSQKEYLKNDERNTIWMRRTLSPGSCGMLGCQSHGGGATLEYVDKDGNVVNP